MFEVILIVSILFVWIYFLLYHFYFDTHCSKTNGLIWNNKHETMLFMWQCKDTYICSIENIEHDKSSRDVISWECNKNKVYYFEPSYYKNKVINIFN